MNGKFLIRIEDTDLKRSDSSLSKNILDDLEWLNITWDEEVIFQRNNFNKHKQIIDQLLDKGLAFRCFTKKDDLIKRSGDNTDKRESVFRSPWRDRSFNELPSEVGKVLKFLIKLYKKEVKAQRVQKLLH